ncbi:MULTISPECIES: TauD/TfdA family dioxygenase [Halomonadaceae]|jgi:alpha-ketoglutarate-dependent taurine dioxygenase|uniref:TauD/TfdA family dioxygenase n=1 Tax=Halomonadaceae TaxID=28256 RepID=UPI0012F419DC|nr:MULTISPECIES: TauD/TfdA family dioxygenase [Halomonas]CAD5274545.1 Dapdiamide synthesis protein DdaC [Halomonas sp. 156]CAD5277409.1 Dapdiamide synthesis protein DdaC [Halomonas sp. 113]CAD5278816.1 Dapdiamide synthesis protein DdaC [Halomonas sp. 59]CAD5284474.1 Dapdiamide synthesis protein DdaC [Halomonas sp. I3]VXC07068.1 Dapdiamide synthesis protein DdaC [Halomonas titanicae]
MDSQSATLTQPTNVISQRQGPVDSELPIMISPAYPGQPLLEAFGDLRADIESLVTRVGGVLLRGFDVPSVDDFQQFAAAFGHPLLSYEFASTPRSAVSSGIYTSTEYPAHQHIPLHNEQAYTREWPMKIWFHCVTASPEGGETPIADSRAIYRRMPAEIRERFAPGILYVRNYGDFDMPWQKVFNTEDRAEVEAFCQRAGIRCEWKPDGDLRTTQLCQSIETHPVTGEQVWFNQGHLFHVSNLQPEVRESLEELLDPEDMPRNVFFADGSPIDDAIFDEIRGVLADETVMFPWQAGDVLMLDNMLVAHARTPFKGPRKVVVAMAEGHGNLSND